jgi:predicted RNA binding protein YcfA (HicA-like mRNA interferase family)
VIYCLDTDILIEFFRGNEKIARKVSSLPHDDGIALTWLSFYEFFKGIFVSGKLEEESFLENLLATCLILESSFDSSRLGGEIYVSLKKEGKLIKYPSVTGKEIVTALKRAGFLVERTRGSHVFFQHPMCFHRHVIPFFSSALSSLHRSYGAGRR